MFIRAIPVFNEPKGTLLSTGKIRTWNGLDWCNYSILMCLFHFANLFLKISNMSLRKLLLHLRDFFPLNNQIKGLKFLIKISKYIH